MLFNSFFDTSFLTLDIDNSPVKESVDALSDAVAGISSSSQLAGKEERTLRYGTQQYAHRCTWITFSGFLEFYGLNLNF